jgi:tetratricopeptide (TPR) repeat protein
MSPYLSATARVLFSPLRLARRRPWSVAAALLVTALAAGTAVWAYARHRWEAARAALAADRPQEGRALLGVPLLVWWWDPDVQVLAARAARLSGDLPAAEAHLKRGLRQAGGATEALQLESLLLRVQTGEVDQVAPALLKAADEGHPEAPLILSTLAVAYMGKLRYQPAYACLSRWIELRPDAAVAYEYRGWVLERMSHYKEGIADYRRALELDPGRFAARLQLASVLVEDNRPLEALPHLERLYRQDPDHPLVQARLGACLLLQGRSTEARRMLEAADAKLPHDPPLQINLARLDLDEGRPAEAEQRLRAVVQADPSDTEAYYALSGAVQAQGRAAEAKELFKVCARAKEVLERTNKLLREVVDRPGSRADDRAELGELLLEIKQEDRGLYWLYQALERDPRNQRAHAALAAHYARKGEADKAAAHRTDPPARER